MESNTFKKQLKKHPQEKFNILSTLLFCWTVPIFKSGLKKDLTEEDVFKTLNKHKSQTVSEQIEQALIMQQKRNKKPSLWLSIWKVFKWDLIICFSLFFITDVVLKISRPLALGKLMEYYNPNPTNTRKITFDEALMYAGIIVLTSLLDSVLDHAYLIHCQQLGIKVKAAFSALIYRKALKLNQKALSEISLGHIINLLANDVTILVRVWAAIHALWFAPIQTVIILYLLYTYCGPTALVGLGFLLTLISIQLFMSKKSASYRLKIALRTDTRIRHMNEVITAIQLIKMYTWEKPFVKLIDLMRRKEMKMVKISNYLQALTVSFGYFIDRTAIFLCILAYTLIGNVPNAQYVFVVSAFYRILMCSVALFLPDAVTRLLKSQVTIKRIENFLNLEEVTSDITHTKEIGVTIEKGSCKWSDVCLQDTLTEINFEARPKEIVAIIGPIGSGKSTLLQMCLNELPLSKGNVQIGGTISYAAQEPWLFASTVRQNIVFGQRMDEEKYSRIVEVCALGPDFAQFPFGDNTIVGERGILLSGGQKARISLARTVYKDADIYLLDDPLSAVDASVGKQIFRDCICNYLKNKCVILVTHQIQYLTSASRIYLLEQGKFTISGTYTDLQASKERFTELLKNTDENKENDESDVKEKTEKKVESKEAENIESRGTGSISKSVYFEYFKSGGFVYVWFIIFLLFVATELLATGSDYFITFWINLEQDRANSSGTITQASETSLIFSTETCVYIYSAAIAALIIISIARSISFIKSCMRASINLHNKMFFSIVNASMRFFQTNSSGRILNRFAGDLRDIDENLPDDFMDVIEVTLSIGVTVLAICTVSPWSLVPTFFVFVVMYFIRMVFLATSRDLKRIEATTKSPIFVHVTETLKGLTTIRAFNIQKTLEREFNEHQDLHNSAFYMNLGCSRAFACWLDTVCILYSSCVTFIVLFNETYGGTVGFIITQSMNLTMIFQWGVRQWSELENQMTSVERVLEYSKLDSEHTACEKVLTKSWPSEGSIDFKSVFFRYSASAPYVLKNVEFSIQPRQKIGIVGRTGAGKSSLIAVLFRLANCEGAVKIDDINVSEISLTLLRSNISIIPQEPILFSGSVRKNLDPFENYSDIQIWNALEDVELKQFISSLSLGLQSELSEGGTNFSVGQKQLMCLARAILRNNKILVLDEATANVDPQTDELIQKTIRRKFQDSTVLTIAHRLHTVMDSNKILVMEAGCVVEFDHPYNLLLSKGTFYDLVMETGQGMYNDLLKIAKEKSLQ